MTAEFFILFAEDVLTNSNKKKKLDIIKYFFDNFIMILFLDTVSPLPEFSLIEDNKVIYSLKILNNDHQKMSDYIIPAYNDIDKIYSLSNKLELLLVNTGPGSYTALRVGIAFLAGLSMSRNIKFIGIYSIAILGIGIFLNLELIGILSIIIYSKSIAILNIGIQS